MGLFSPVQNFQRIATLNGKYKVLDCTVEQLGTSATQPLSDYRAEWMRRYRASQTFCTVIAT